MHTLNYGVIFTSLAHLHPPGGVSGNTLKSWMLKEMAEKQMDRHKQLGWKMAKKDKKTSETTQAVDGTYFEKQRTNVRNVLS